MYPVVASGHSPWSNELIRDLTDEEFRHEYMMDQVRSFIAFQIRALREQPGRRWSQGDLAKKSGKTQSVISRSEDPDYGKLSLQSLLEIAIAFDLPLLVQFVEWDDWLARMSNLSPSALRKRSFDAGRLMKTGGEVDSAAVAVSGLMVGPQTGVAVGPSYLAGSIGLNTAITVGSANVGLSTNNEYVAYPNTINSGQSLLTSAQMAGAKDLAGHSNFSDVPTNSLPAHGISIQGQPVYAQ